jgi:hypothetical protein
MAWSTRKPYSLQPGDGKRYAARIPGYGLTYILLIELKLMWLEIRSGKGCSMVRVFTIYTVAMIVS